MSEISQVINVGSVPIEIRKSKKARSMRISIKSDGSVVATYPARVALKHILELIDSKIDWIQEKVSEMKARKPILVLKHTPKERKEYFKQAHTLVLNKLEAFNQYYNFSYKNVFIRNQKTRWGSCSSKKNLSFNYKIIFLSQELQDYLIVHELCHLKEMNHGSDFWELIGRQIPEYKILRKTLRLGDF